MVSATWLIRYREETREASGGYDYVSERTTVKTVRLWILKEKFGFGNPDRLLRGCRLTMVRGHTFGICCHAVYVEDTLSLINTNNFMCTS